MTLRFPFGMLLFTGFRATQAEFETNNWSHGFKGNIRPQRSLWSHSYSVSKKKKNN